MKLVTAEYKVANAKGVHGRVATRLAEIALQYEVEIRLVYQGREADCASILDVLSMALVKGSVVEVRLIGGRSEAALQVVGDVLTAEKDP